MGVSSTFDYESLAKEALRALRGKRTQTAFSRRLGYRSNASRSWEVGRAFPTASKFLWIASRVGVTWEEPLVRFAPGFALPTKVSSARIAALLGVLRGNRTLQDIAHATGHSRYAIARFVSGEAEPKLPELLQLIDVLSLKLLDFVACFVDPSTLPSVRDAWQRLCMSRSLATEHPFSHAVLRALELDAYRKLKRHEPGWIAQKLGITLDEEQRYLDLLVQSGQAERIRRRYRPAQVQTVDMRLDPDEARKVRAFWNEVALERLRGGARRTFSYNVFSVSHEDMERIRALYRAFFAEVRDIVARSEPADCVALGIVNLLELDESVK